jgi:hypothetical protein
LPVGLGFGLGPGEQPVEPVVEDRMIDARGAPGGARAKVGGDVTLFLPVPVEVEEGAVQAQGTVCISNGDERAGRH